MSTTIKATNITLSPTLRDYVEKKVSSFEKFVTKHNAEMQCDVELRESTHHQKGPFYYAEINLSLDGNLYRATADEESYEAAIDKVKDEIVRELSKGKAKHRVLWHRGARKVKEWVRGSV